MALAAKIDILIGAKTGTLERGFKRARKHTQQFAASVTRLGVALGTAAAASYAFFVRKEMQAIDTTGKLAARIGISTEALLGFEHAATITGTSTEKLHKGLMFLSKSLGELKTRAEGEAKYALEALNISADELLNLGLAGAVEEIADRMQGLGTQAEKTYVASQLMGRGGRELVNFFDLGSEGIRRMAEDLERLGGMYTALDARGVERANDAIHRLRQATRAFVTQEAIRVAPLVELTANKLADMFSGAHRGMDEMQNNTARLISEFGVLGTVVLRVVDAFQWFNLQWLEIQKGLIEMNQWNTEFRISAARMAGLTEHAAALQVELDVLIHQWAELNDRIQHIQGHDAMEELKAAIRSTREELESQLGQGLDEDEFKIPEMLGKWQDQMDALMMSTREKELFDISHLIGADDPFTWERVTKQFDKFKDLERQAGVKRWAEGLRDPLQDLRSNLTDLQELMHQVDWRGRPLIDEETGIRAMENMREELQNILDIKESIERPLDWGGNIQGTASAFRRELEGTRLHILQGAEAQRFQRQGMSEEEASKWDEALSLWHQIEGLLRDMKPKASKVGKA